MSLFKIGRKNVAEPTAGDPDSLKLVIYRSELERIRQWAGRFPDIETGGDLFGYFTHSGAPVACRAIGPGPRCRRSRTSFYQDEDYLLRQGVGLYRKHGLQHIGEWHSHHSLGLPHPSTGDLATVTRGLREQGWRRFVLGIISFKEPGARIESRFYVVRPEGDYLPLRLAVLPGSSPIRHLEPPQALPAGETGGGAS